MCQRAFPGDGARRGTRLPSGAKEGGKIPGPERVARQTSRPVQASAHGMIVEVLVVAQEEDSDAFGGE
jgi:hypothetical protein